MMIMRAIKLPTVSVDNSWDRLGVDGAIALISYVCFKLCDLRSKTNKCLLFNHLRRFINIKYDFDAH